jgi:hypothetical protein
MWMTPANLRWSFILPRLAPFPPAATRLRTLGWGLVAASVLAAAVIVAIHV